jgi:hypothetical protein
MYKEIILDSLTGKETSIEFSAKEIIEVENNQQEQAAREQAQLEAEAQKQALKDSANSKLAALGLTPDEIAAITGAN